MSKLQELIEWATANIDNIQNDEGKLFSEIERDTEPYFRMIDKAKQLQQQEQEE